MPDSGRKLFASYISKQLSEAGHQRSTCSDDGTWMPGFRAEQLGDQVVVFCEGPIGRGNMAAEASRLAEYALALSNLGHLVETVPRPEINQGPARRKLIVSRRVRAVADA